MKALVDKSNVWINVGLLPTKREYYALKGLELDRYPEQKLERKESRSPLSAVKHVNQIMSTPKKQCLDSSSIQRNARAYNITPFRVGGKYSHKLEPPSQLSIQFMNNLTEECLLESGQDVTSPLSSLTEADNGNVDRTNERFQDATPRVSGAFRGTSTNIQSSGVSLPNQMEHTGDTTEDESDRTGCTTEEEDLTALPVPWSPATHSYLFSRTPLQYKGASDSFDEPADGEDDGDGSAKSFPQFDGAYDDPRNVRNNRPVPTSSHNIPHKVVERKAAPNARTVSSSLQPQGSIASQFASINVVRGPEEAHTRDDIVESQGDGDDEDHGSEEESVEIEDYTVTGPNLEPLSSPTYTKFVLGRYVNGFDQAKKLTITLYHKNPSSPHYESVHKTQYMSRKGDQRLTWFKPENIDWDDRKMIAKLNQWQCQIYKRARGGNGNNKRTYLPIEREFISAERAKDIPWKDITQKFNKRFAGSIVEGDKHPRPKRTLHSVRTDGLRRALVSSKAVEGVAENHPPPKRGRRIKPRGSIDTVGESSSGGSKGDGNDRVGTEALLHNDIPMPDADDTGFGAIVKCRKPQTFVEVEPASPEDKATTNPSAKAPGKRPFSAIDEIVQGAAPAPKRARRAEISQPKHSFQDFVQKSIETFDTMQKEHNFPSGDFAQYRPHQRARSATAAFLPWKGPRRPAPRPTRNTLPGGYSIDLATQIIVKSVKHRVLHGRVVNPRRCEEKDGDEILPGQPLSALEWAAYEEILEGVGQDALEGAPEDGEIEVEWTG
ncbi:hypothetical protein M501DRAFT_1002323 [Patellaria atrata CBS 101060]|uniref:Uncharacterized protein n=1 Tax=Patellaria atrata CBS 101060 TaxID=1346257 RepID=A0A9P4VS37_9PEZI|nr:hypothetical protein M501DRAFT_1002323 [Patellaria atrata CBS 101060]